jgi:TetR/AcrR family transcriptional repressor of nem operon
MAGVRRFNEMSILDRLALAFWAQGYEATSIEDLERATGLKRQSLYNTFGSKPEMYVKALDRYGANLAGPIEAALDHPNPRVALRRLLDLYVGRMADPNCPAGCLVAGSCQELGGRPDDLGKYVADTTRSAEAELTVRFERWCADGLMKAEADPRRLARFVVALVRGMASVHRATAEIDAVRDAADVGFAAVESWLATEPRQARNRS